MNKYASSFEIFSWEYYSPIASLNVNVANLASRELRNFALPLNKDL